MNWGGGCSRELSYGGGDQLSHCHSFSYLNLLDRPLVAAELPPTEKPNDAKTKV